MKLCYNCLKGRHSSRDCLKGKCNICHRKHHTLLHSEAATPARYKSSSVQQASFSNVSTNHQHSTLQNYMKKSQQTVLLATARIVVKTPHGTLHIARALLDSGSQSSYISEDCVYRMALKSRRASIPISGVFSSHAGTTKGIVNVIIKPSHDVNCEIPLDALVLKRITNYELSSLLSINDFPQF